MSPREADRFVRKCASALRSHASDFDMGWDKENALAAFDMVVGVLLEIREHYPAERANIDEVLRRHGYSMLDSGYGEVMDMARELIEQHLRPSGA